MGRVKVPNLRRAVQCVRSAHKRAIGKIEDVCGTIAKRTPFKTASFGWPQDIAIFPRWLDREFTGVKPPWVREVVFLPRRPTRRLALARPCKPSEKLLWQRYEQWTPPERYVAHLKNVVASRNAVIDPSGCLIWPLSYEFLPKPTDHYLLKRPFLGWRGKKLAGRCLLLTTPEASNYWHWLTDGLQKLKVLEDAGIRIEAFDWFLVNWNEYDFQRESLARLRVPLERVINTNTHPHLDVDELTVPSWSEQSGVYDPDDLNWLRSRLYKGELNESEFPKRFVISRSGARYRKLLNEAEILEELGSAGFCSVTLEKLSFADQVCLFRGAEVVIAPHGAGLTNIMFCKPRTHVLEIVNPNFAHQMFYYMASVSGLDYRYTIASPSGSEEPQKQHLTADVKAIVRLAREWG